VLTELSIEGVGCASCVAKIEAALSAVPGVNSAEMNFAQRTVQVDGTASEPELVLALNNAGYQAKSRLTDSPANPALEFQQKRIRQVYVSLGLAALLMCYGFFIGSMRVSAGFNQLYWLFVGLLSLSVMVYSGSHYYKGTWKSLVNHTATMDTLIGLGTASAWLYSMVVVIFVNNFPFVARHVYFEAAVMIIALVNLGSVLESKARGKSGEAIQRLLDLKPKTALVIAEEQERLLNVSEVQKDDRIKLKPGDMVPVDGVVVEGVTCIDESMISGEPVPKDKTVGDMVTGGTINKNGSIVFQATQVGENTTLAKIVNLVKKAQNSKPPIGRLVDRVSNYFVPGIILCSIASALLWFFSGHEQSSVYAFICATSVLIIACPCALGLATPTSIMVGIGKAAEYGAFIRNGDALQTAAKIETLVLDKTGTITKGQPEVVAIACFGHFQEDRVLSLAASVESHSEHHLASAILSKSADKKLNYKQGDNFVNYEGRGASAVVGDSLVICGNSRLMKQNGIDIDLNQPSKQDLGETILDSATLIYVAINGELAGIIQVQDPIKPDAFDAILRLRKMGIRVLMLTGDNAGSAQAVANAVGLIQVIADVLPTEKAEKIQRLKSSGAIVAMVGDGINDAPALANSDVGFAIGSGTDVAIESSDIVLLRDSLMGVVDAISVSTATMTNIKQNLFGAFFYNLAGVPLAAGLLYPIWGILLNPMVAGAAMALSSFTVVSNANRLRYFTVK